MTKAYCKPTVSRVELRAVEQSLIACKIQGMAVEGGWCHHGTTVDACLPTPGLEACIDVVGS